MAGAGLLWRPAPALLCHRMEPNAQPLALALGHVSVTRRYRFSSAHRLYSTKLSENDNWKIFGKCYNPNGHGHNYVVYVTVSGRLDDHTGTVADLEALDHIVTRTIVQRFDHQDLNQDPEFSTNTTTGENLAMLVWDLLAKESLPGRLEKVGVVETRDNYFEYAGA